MALTHLVERYCELPIRLRKPLWRFLHYLVGKLDGDGSTLFLNYGFAEGNGAAPPLALAPEEEKDRNAIQLYHHVSAAVDLRNASVLEVGCGRGGGAAFLSRRLEPSEYIGLDISKATTAFCNEIHRIPCLSFVLGEAERIPFPADRFEAVINIESARCYGDLGAFFREVFRVLKPQGHFLFADISRRGDLDRTRAGLLKAGFQTLRASDIRENVILALRQDSEAREAAIESRVPEFMKRGFHEVSATARSDRFRAFVDGEFAYWSFVLRKPRHSPDRLEDHAPAWKE
jgi:ubiquinone/menaquinone biosynthesis C-methylase UbiE